MSDVDTAAVHAAIRVSVENQDNGSRDLFVKLLKDEEGHVDWFEAQLHQIKEIGSPSLRRICLFRKGGNHKIKRSEAWPANPANLASPANPADPANPARPLLHSLARVPHAL